MSVAFVAANANEGDVLQYAMENNQPVFIKKLHIHASEMNVGYSKTKPLARLACRHNAYQLRQDCPTRTVYRLSIFQHYQPSGKSTPHAWRVEEITEEAPPDGAGVLFGTPGWTPCVWPLFCGEPE